MTNAAADTKTPGFSDLYPALLGLDKPYPKLTKAMFKASPNPEDFVQEGAIVFYVASFGAREAIPFVVLETPAKIKKTTQVKAMSLATGATTKIFACEQTMDGSEWCMNNEFPQLLEAEQIEQLTELHGKIGGKKEPAKRAAAEVEGDPNPEATEPKAKPKKRSKAEVAPEPEPEQGSAPEPQAEAEMDDDPFSELEAAAEKQEEPVPIIPPEGVEDGSEWKDEQAGVTYVRKAGTWVPKDTIHPADEPKAVTEPEQAEPAKGKRGKKAKEEPKPIKEAAWMTPAVAKLMQEVFDAAHAALNTLEALKTCDSFPSTSFASIANMGSRITSYALHAEFRGKACGQDITLDPTIELPKINFVKDAKEMVIILEAAPEKRASWQKVAKLAGALKKRAEGHMIHLSEEGMDRIVSAPEPLRDADGKRLVDPA